MVGAAVKAGTGGKESLAPEGEPLDKFIHLFSKKNRMFHTVEPVVYDDSTDNQEAQHKCDPVGHECHAFVVACPF
jgi:hypothetical protein